MWAQTNREFDCEQVKINSYLRKLGEDLKPTTIYAVLFSIYT